MSLCRFYSLRLLKALHVVRGFLDLFSLSNLCQFVSFMMFEFYGKSNMWFNVFSCFLGLFRSLKVVVYFGWLQLVGWLF